MSRQCWVKWDSVINWTNIHVGASRCVDGRHSSGDAEAFPAIRVPAHPNSTGSIEPHSISTHLSLVSLTSLTRESFHYSGRLVLPFYRHNVQFSQCRHPVLKPIGAGNTIIDTGSFAATARDRFPPRLLPILHALVSTVWRSQGIA
jgi:hypothetical protein